MCKLLQGVVACWTYADTPIIGKDGHLLVDGEPFQGYLVAPCQKPRQVLRLQGRRYLYGRHGARYRSLHARACRRFRPVRCRPLWRRLARAEGMALLQVEFRQRFVVLGLWFSGQGEIRHVHGTVHGTETAYVYS